MIMAGLLRTPTLSVCWNAETDAQAGLKYANEV